MRNLRIIREDKPPSLTRETRMNPKRTHGKRVRNGDLYLKRRKSWRNSWMTKRMMIL
jgi:hypothetical protein